MRASLTLMLKHCRWLAALTVGCALLNGQEVGRAVTARFPMANALLDTPEPSTKPAAPETPQVVHRCHKRLKFGVFAGAVGTLTSGLYLFATANRDVQFQNGSMATQQHRVGRSGVGIALIVSAPVLIITGAAQRNCH